MEIALYLEDAQQSDHVENFLRHCGSGNYNDNCIVRYIPDFILQCGDPTNTGRVSEPADPQNAFTGPKQGNWKPQTINIERGTIMSINHKEHLVGSQFFIVLSDQHAAALGDRNQYTPIGKSVGSLGALDQVESSAGLGSENLKKNGKIKGQWKEEPWIKTVEIRSNPYA